MNMAQDKRVLAQFKQSVEALPFVDAVLVDGDAPRLRVWVITHSQDADQAVEIFGIQNDWDPEYQLDVKVRTRTQYDALVEVH
jgi:hypothetical protein